MYYQLTSYLKFLLHSSNQHGVHSPFVYKLVTRCFNDTTNYPDYAILKAYRKELLISKETIAITDFGAGSRVFKSNQRKISAIAKTAGITSNRQRLLYRLLKYFKSESILELGTSLGLGTAALSLGSSSAKVTTIEGCANTSAVAQKMFAEFQLENVISITANFEAYFRKNKNTRYDFVYIDGNHNGEKTLAYFELLRKCAHNETVLVFDDIYWSPEMTEAWNQIILHPDVTVSIDTYYWGFVFFRKEQQKEHFKIRL